MGNMPSKVQEMQAKFIRCFLTILWALSQVPFISQIAHLGVPNFILSPFPEFLFTPSSA